MGALSQRKKRQQMEAAKKNQGTQPRQPVDIWELLREQSTIDDPFEEIDPEPEIEIIKEKPVDTVPEPKPVYQFSSGDEGTSDMKQSSLEKPPVITSYSIHYTKLYDTDVVFDAEFTKHRSFLCQVADTTLRPFVNRQTGNFFIIEKNLS